MGAVTDSTDQPPDDGNGKSPAGHGARVPGLLLIYAAGKPTMVLLPLQDQPVEIGRGHALFGGKEDAMMSRQHARVGYREDRFEFTELGSRNGSALDGRPLTGSVSVQAGGVLRLGHSLFLLCRDLSPYRTLGLKHQDGRVEGPALQRAMRSAARLAEHSPTLFIAGESGAGKESMARVFHSAGPGGPFIAVNCATIPDGLAERLLFGAQKGAYSGATTDSAGYLQAADRGTLFLDEIAELDTGVQAKLLRTLESGEVTPLGATRPRKVDLRICSATHQDLRAQATAGKFRADLYFRLGMPQVLVPPLRQRPEEIPWHVVHAVARVATKLKVAAHLIEACLLRSWPGNVRELLAEINTAAVNALSAGQDVVHVNHLSEHAGAALVAPADVPGVPAGPAVEDTRRIAREGTPGAEAAGPKRTAPTRAQLMVALLEAKGNLSATARALGLHRTQLRRYLRDERIDPDRLREMDKG